MSHVQDALQRANSQDLDQPEGSELAPRSPIEGNALQPLIAMFVRRKRLFFGVFFGFFIFCAVIVMLLPRKFEAEMKLLVKNERQELVISPDSNTSTTHSSDPTENDINSEIELLRSRDVLRRVALESHLSLPESGTVQAAGEVSPVSLDKALAGLAHDLAITAIKKSNVIDVTYTSTDAEMAGNVLNRLQEAYLDVHLKMHGAPGSFSFFDQQAKAFSERLKMSQDELKLFEEKNSGLVQPDQDQSLTTHAMETQASLEQIDSQIADYQHRITKDKDSLAGLDSRVVTQVRTIPQAQLIGNLNQTLIDLRNKQTDAIAKFRHDDRRILELNQQITDTTAALHDALQQIPIQPDGYASVKQIGAAGFPTIHRIASAMAPICCINRI